MQPLIQPQFGYHIYGWMLNLGLRGLELNLFALIHSFTANGGAVSRIAFFEAWTNAKKGAIRTALSALMSRNLIISWKGQRNTTLYAVAPGASQVGRNPDYSENRPTLRQTTPGIQPSSQPVSDPEWVGIRPTITKENDNQKTNESTEMINTPTQEEIFETIKALNPPFPERELADCAAKWLDSCLSTGWIDRHGQRIRDWHAHLRNYARAWVANSRTSTPNRNPNDNTSHVELAKLPIVTKIPADRGSGSPAPAVDQQDYASPEEIKSIL